MGSGFLGHADPSNLSSIFVGSGSFRENARECAEDLRGRIGDLCGAWEGVWRARGAGSGSFRENTWEPVAGLRARLAGSCPPREGRGGGLGFVS
jgi:hypothetical protein